MKNDINGCSACPNKIRMTFIAEQKLCGLVRKIHVIQNTREMCMKKIKDAFRGKSFTVTILNTGEKVDDWFPVGFWNADDYIPVYCVPALPSDLEPHSTNS